MTKFPNTAKSPVTRAIGSFAELKSKFARTCVWLVVVLASIVPSVAAAQESIPEQIIDYVTGGAEVCDFNGSSCNDNPGDNAIALGSQQNDSVVIYVNGVQNTPASFVEALVKLQAVVGSEIDVDGFYNSTGFEELNTANELSTEFACGGVVNGWFDEVWLTIQCSAWVGLQLPGWAVTEGGSFLIDGLEYLLLQGESVDGEAVWFGSSARKLKDTIVATLNADPGRRVILVAHSEGNIFARGALQLLVDEATQSGKDYFKSVAVIMAGSPISLEQMPSEIEAAYKICVKNDEICYLGEPTLALSHFGTVEDAKNVISTDHTDEFLDQINCSVVFDPGGPAQHNFVSNYLEGKPSNCIKTWIREFDTSDERIADVESNVLRLVDTEQIPEPNSVVTTTVNLNVRTARLVDASTYKYTVDASSIGMVMDEGSRENALFWYSVCFDAGTASVPTGMPGGNCGYVWAAGLQFDGAPVLLPPAPYVPLSAPIVQEVQQDASGLISASTADTYPQPNDPDSLFGLSGCTNCSTSVPSAFSMQSGVFTCVNGTVNAHVIWDPSTGADIYEIYRNGEQIGSKLNPTSFDDSFTFNRDLEYYYFVKARNTNGSRNAGTAWQVELSPAICGVSPPPEPPEIALPYVVTSAISEIEPTTVRLNGVVSPNGQYTYTYFEYGETTNYGNATNSLSQGYLGQDIPFGFSIFVDCGTSYHFRAVSDFTEFGGTGTGTVYGDDLAFTMPPCASEPPSNLVVTHDPFNDSLDLQWDEPIVFGNTALLPELMVVGDPRPSVATGVWSERPSQADGVGKWSDIWLDPQPGGEYCYRIRTWNTAAIAGYSGYSNEACITVEGTFVQQVDFPNNPYVRTNPGVGLRFNSDTGGIGDFDIERRRDTEPFIVIGTVTAPVIAFSDTDVTSGTTYCYRFSQSGISSQEYCGIYLDLADFGSPTLLSVTRIAPNQATLTWTSPHPEVGYFRIRYYDNPALGWRSGGTGFYSGIDPIQSTKYIDEVFESCYKIAQDSYDVVSPDSNTLCLAAGENQVSYTPPAQNTDPFANDDLFSVEQDSSDNSFDVFGDNGSGPDGDADGDLISIIDVGIPSGGGVAAVNGNADGLIYTPPPGFVGNETFTYTIDDGKGGTATALVTASVVLVPPQSAVRGDMDGDGKSDILWRNPTMGQNWMFRMHGSLVDGSTSVPTVLPAWEVGGTGDFDGDGKADILWRNPTTGQNWMFRMNGSLVDDSTSVPTVLPAWEVGGTGDFDGDGKADILWRNPTTGQNWMFRMHGSLVDGSTSVPTVLPAWEVGGTGDFDGDGKADILWRNPTTGQNWMFRMNGSLVDDSTSVPTVLPAWEVGGTGDFDGDGKADILWRNPTTGQNWMFRMNGSLVDGSTSVPTVLPAWEVGGTGDFDGDGKADILWRNPTTGQNWMFRMNGSLVDDSTSVPTVLPAWDVANVD